MEKTNLPELVIIHLPADLKAELEAIKGDALGDFGKAHRDGVEISGSVYNRIRGVIVHWCKYHYRWVDGQNKMIKTGLSAEEACQEGYKPGGDIVVVQARNRRVTFPLPMSSYLRFATYADHLGRSGLAPHEVITEIGSTIVNFKLGAQPVLTFTPIGPAGPPDPGGVVEAEFSPVPSESAEAPLSPEAPPAKAANLNNPWA
jgi:hypothetical protein